MVKATLLVVEDEQNLLFGIRDILEHDDYRVLTARDGTQALQVLEDEKDTLPDLIVSDIMMPHMNGLELLQAVRRNDEWLRIPFIFLTARGEKDDVQLGKRLGVDDYIIKPFDIDDLLVAVDAKLERHRHIQNTYTTMVDSMVGSFKRGIITMLNHELRTPLTLVVAYADMLKEANLDQMSKDEMLLFLGELNSGADRLRRLIENFMLLVEIKSGDAAGNFSWRSYPINDIEKIIQAAHDQVFNPEGVMHVCQINIQRNLPPVHSDRDYLMVIVRELLHNAVKFSSPDDPVQLDACVLDGEVCISVTDHGRGIPEHELDNIWEEFYQINRELYEDQGSGSGLTIVKGLVNLHQGARVEVESYVDQGSCFRVLFPIAEAK